MRHTPKHTPSPSEVVGTLCPLRVAGWGEGNARLYRRDKKSV